MNLIGSLSSMIGNRSQSVNVNSKPISPQGQSFQESLKAARATTDGSMINAFISPELGAPTLQWYYNNYIKGSAPLTMSLSEAQLNSLAEKFDPKNMNQDSYDLFVDTLVETGIFTKDELYAIAYGEVRTDGDSPEEGTYLPYSNNGNRSFGADFEMQEWARANSILLRGNAMSVNGNPAFSIKQADTLMKLMPILEKIANKRG